MRLRIRSTLLLLLACVPAAATAQGQRAADNELEPVRRCHATVRSAPSESLRLAQALLAEPKRSAAVEAGALTCRAIAESQLGQSSAVAASVVELQALAERPDLAQRDRHQVLFITQTLMIERGDSALALPILQRLLDEANAGDDVPRQVMVLTGLAALHSQGMADDAGALVYLDRAIALTRSVPRAPHEGDVMLHYNRAYALTVLKRYAEAERALTEAERMARRVGGQGVLLYRIAGHRAEINRVTGQLDAAEAELRRVLVWQAANDSQGKVVTLQRLARIAMDRGADDEAAALANEALTLARQTRMVAEIRGTLELLFEVQTHRGDTAAALAIGRELREMDQARTRGSSLDRLARLQSKAEQTLGTPTLAAEINERRDRLLRNAALAGLLLVVGFALWLHRRHRRQRQHLEALGRNDRLTGLLNRAEAERCLGRLSRPGQGERRTALLRIDVEGFKEFNERYGQHAGDQALRVLAEALQALADEQDMLSRWSGRSLLVARAETRWEAATALAAQLQSQLSGLALPGLGSETLQVSVGLAPLPLFNHGSSEVDDSLRAIDCCMQDIAAHGRPGWAALWGRADADAVDLETVLRDPLQAAAQGHIALASGRVQGWAGVTAATPARFG